MADDDFAILVGISTYADPQFPKLDGPPNDIALMKQWLLDPAGGALLEKNIVVIESPEKAPEGIDPYDMPPRRDAFEKEFNKLAKSRLALQNNRLKGRLYLYFSGHGFCNRFRFGVEAALHTANASRTVNEHMFGTFYANVAKNGPLYGETILIMDCCRASEINRQPLPGTTTVTPEEALSVQAQLMMIYAAPKGGLAQEREIKERDGKVYGLLTHALIKALDEARPTPDGHISSTRLKDLMLQSWETVCGPDAPALPDIITPSAGEILFGARNNGGEFTIKFVNPQPPGAMLTLRNWKLQKVADFSATGNPADDLLRADGPVLSFQRQAGDLVLRLQRGFYEYSVSTGSSGPIQIPDKVQHVDV
jgi:hypothetical protein